MRRRLPSHNDFAWRGVLSTLVDRSVTHPLSLQTARPAMAVVVVVVVVVAVVVVDVLSYLTGRLTMTVGVDLASKL